ncbi:MAG: hypothetical protein C0394_08030 [Syntrophus sp. (in: bacteria)]|nr:hypothetical protein [Syntrophus sp. (in: bacteria)]
MKVREYPVASEPAAERMVLGRMVLRIEDSGRAVLEAMLPHNAVSADEVHQPATPDENPTKGPRAQPPESRSDRGLSGG